MTSYSRSKEMFKLEKRSNGPKDSRATEPWTNGGMA